MLLDVTQSELRFAEPPDVAAALSSLRLEDQPIYGASAANGIFHRNYTRDVITYAMLSGDLAALEAQVAYSALHQGTVSDPLTGEEPGKPHHEWPGVMWDGLQTTYNACDTAALLLLGMRSLQQVGVEYVTTRYAGNIDAAAAYILSHVQDGLFYEDPRQSGATRFALGVTYWKDSVIHRENEHPVYPIVYTLPHFQNAAALKAAGHMLERYDLIETSDSMVQTGIDQLWSDDHFITAHDGDGVIDPISSDSLHSLLYIEPSALPAGYAERIQDYSRTLETKAGYQTALPIDGLTNPYHTGVWAHEQGLLNAGARRHSLDEAAAVSAQVRGYIATFPERIDPRNGFKPAGGEPMLWTVGTHQLLDNPGGSYFDLAA